MIRLEGQFHLPRQSKAWYAQIRCLDDGTLLLTCPEASIDAGYTRAEYQLGDALPGLPISVNFPDESIFTPNKDDQEAFKEWAQPFRKDKISEWFERSLKALILTIVFLPLMIIGFYQWGIPALAHNSAELIPYTLQKQAGDETLIILEEAYLSESTLAEEEKQAIETKWRKSLADLEIENRDSFRLLFRQSEVFHKNAFALPNRTIVITDSLIRSLDQSQNEVLAILLHETGHVVYQHGVKKILESAYVTFFTTMLLGDVDAIGDIFLSVGAGVVNNAFSRDMEREADQFAIQGFKQLNQSPIAFATAMEKLTNYHNSHTETSWFEELFHTHPNTLERIEAAKQQADENPENN